MPTYKAWEEWVDHTGRVTVGPLHFLEAEDPEHARDLYVETLYPASWQQFWQTTGEDSTSDYELGDYPDKLDRVRVELMPASRAERRRNFRLIRGGAS